MKKMKRIIKIFTFSFLVLFFVGGLIWHVAEAAPQGEMSKEEVLVGLEDNSTPEDYGFIEARGGEVVNELENINVLVVELPEKAVERAMNMWDRSPRISYVEENGEMYALGEGSWGTERIGSREAQEKSTGEGVKVGILDSGIDVNHEALKENIEGGEAIVECSPHPHCDEPWDDDHGHGTHVAGTAGSVNKKIGVATEVELYSIKVLDRNARGSVSDVSEGIIWAADNDMEVINMSLGSSSDSYGNTIREAVQYANEEGVIQVAAAGNNNLEEDSVVYPAAFEEVIAVSATNENDEMAEFSSIGPEVELAAPGADIYSAWEGGRYYEGNGTSMASPHVAGVAALVLAMEGYETEEEVREHLQETAEDIGFDENKQGYGLVNAAEAVGIDVEIETGSLEGTVKDGEKNPLEDATVEIEDIADTTTDENGEYSFEEISTGDYKVTALKDGYESETKEVTIQKDETVEQNFNLEKIETYTVSGEVVDIEKNESIEGATVEIEDTEYSATTDKDGEYSIEDVEEGTYDITASADGYHDKTKNIDVSGDTTVDLELEEKEDEEKELKITEFEVEDRSNPAWTRVEVTWTVQGSELETVELKMIEDEEVMDSKTIDVSGSEADGVDELRSRDGGSYIVITVTDKDDNEEGKEKSF